MRTQFGSFVIDGSARRLERRGSPVHLTPKAFELLELLIGRRPEALRKSEIHDHLWPETYVGHVSLPVLVHELRHALGDNARSPTWVRTVARFGYAFCGSAREEREPTAGSASILAEYRLRWRGREIALAPGDHILGRTPEATIWVEHASVSRRHALVCVSQSGATIEDCGSKNGTFLGGKRIAGTAALHDGDAVLLGRARLVFRALVRDEGSTQTDAGSGPTTPVP